MAFSFCPNISHPDNKKRIKEVGKEAFYKEYYNEHFDINPTFSVIDKLFVDIDKFSIQQQSEIVDSIIYEIEEGKKEGFTSVADLFDYAKEVFTNQKEALEETGDSDWAPYIQKFNDIDSNWDRFKDKVSDKLKTLGVRVTKTFADNTTSDTQETSDTPQLTQEVTDEVSEDFVTTEAAYQKDNYDDGFNFSRSSKDTASGHLKLKLSTIPEVEYRDGKLESKENFLMLSKFMPLDKVWNTLQRELTGLQQSEILPRLTELAKSNPMFAEVLNQIQSDENTAIQNEFIVTFSKQQAKFITPKIGNLDKAGARTIKVFGTNRQGAEDIVLEDWYDKFKQSPFVTVSDGEAVVDIERSKKALVSFNTFVDNFDNKKPEDLVNLQKGLAGLGINLSPTAIQNFAKFGTKVDKTKYTAKEFLQKYGKLIFRRLAGEFSEASEDSKLELNNPFISETTAIKALSRLELAANPFLYEGSFISGDGKAKYSYVNNSYISRLFNKLNGESSKDFLTDIISTTYSKSSIWANELLNNPKFVENFSLNYFDTLGTDESNVINKPFTKMSTKEKEFTRLSLFQNQGRDAANFFGLIPSDKTTLPVISALKTKVVLNSSVQVTNREALNALYTPFIAEYNRILDVQKQQKDPSVGKIQGYHNGMGEKFLVYDFLNNNTELFDENGQLKVIDAPTLQRMITPEIQKFISKGIKNQLNYWNELGIFDKDDKSKYQANPFDKTYKSKLGDYAKQDDYEVAMAADYMVNQFLANFNYTQLISGDPALHGKKSVAATWINYSKRLAKDIAPGLDGNFEKDSFRTMFLKDLSVPSAHLAEYQEILGDKSKAYAEINPADAQEYTTLAEHIAVMKAYGKLTPEITAASQRLLDGGESPEDIELILQPMKPVYVGTKVDKALGINRMYYIKTSSFPLIPALTKGLEIDKLRVAMENHKIDRAVYESGVKLGLAGNIQSVYNEDGTFNDNLVDTGVVLSRDGFRIQQEIPYHGHNNTINEGSQARKLVLLDVEDDVNLDLFGKQLTGKEAKQLYEDLHIEKMNRAFTKLLSDIGANADGKFENLDKLQSVLIEEATSRGYNINDVYGLQIVTDPETGRQRFQIPLGFNNSSSRLESILNALVTNRVIKQELPGFTKVQGASVGFNKVKTLDQLSSFVKDSIVWLDSSDTELKYIRKNEDGTKLLQADILVPSWFKDADGHSIDLKQFIKEDGTLDTSKIPEDLLTVIGIRIPTQGYGSMMSFKVKGFLSTLVGDLAIVPAEITAQMGSDFDVDKLFLYRYEYTLTDGKLSKVKPAISNLAKASPEAINNAIIQFYEDRYQDVNLLSKILEPNGFGRLPKLAKEISKKLGLDKSNNFLLPQEQNKIHKNNNDGKAGTGIFSLFSTFIKAAQDAKLALAVPITFKVDDKVIASKSLYSNGITGVAPSTIVAYFQSAAVDNAKEQLLGSLNINSQTMDVAATIALAGFDERYIAYFLSQPIIREYVQGLENSNDITNPRYNPRAEDELIDRLVGFKDAKKFLLSSPINIEQALSLEDLQNELSNSTRQSDVLKLFIIAKEMAKGIRAIQNAINTDTGGLGTRFVDLQVKAANIVAAQESEKILNVSTLFEGTTIATASEMVFKSLDMWRQILPYNSSGYLYKTNEVLELMGRAGEEIRADELNSIYSGIKSYLYSKAELLQSNAVATVNNNVERQELLYGSSAIGNRWEAYISSPAGKKNILAERIKVRRGVTVDEPVRLEAVNTPAANGEDTNQAMAAMYQMYYKGSSEEKALVNDMMKYFLLTGAKGGPNSISKYIPYDLLEQYQLSSKLAEIDSKLQNGEELLDGFTEQYFQHNPSKAISFETSKVIDYKTTGFKLSKESDYAIPTFNDFGKKIYTYPTYMSIYDRTIKGFMLYKIADNTDKEATYSRIDVLGDRNGTEYNADVLKQSSIHKANQSGLEIPDTIKKEITDVVDPVETIQVENVIPIDQDYLKSQLKLDTNLETSLNTIISNPQVDEFNNIAKDLKRVLASYPTISLGTETRKGIAGSYSNGTVNLNLDNIVLERNPLEKAQRVLLHETLHAITAAKLANYNNLSTEDKKKVDKIKVLFNKYRTLVSSDELTKYTDLKNRYIAKEQLSQDQVQFLRDNKQKYYALDSLDDFIAAGLTDEQFVQQLKSNNFWNQLWDAITSLLGLNYQSDYDALYNTVLDLGLNDVNPQANKLSRITIPSDIKQVLKDNARTRDTNISQMALQIDAIFSNITNYQRAKQDTSVWKSIESGGYFKYTTAEDMILSLENQRFIDFLTHYNLLDDMDRTLSQYILTVRNENIVEGIMKIQPIVDQLDNYTTYTTTLVPGEFDNKEFNTIKKSNNDFNPLSTPREQKQEFLSKYHLKDGQTMSLSHFDKINSSVRANTKYNNIRLDLPYENGKRVLRVYTKGGQALYDINPEVKTKEEIFVEEAIKRLQSLRAKIKSNANFASNVQLQSKYDELSNRIQKLKEDNSLQIVLDDINNRIVLIAERLETPGLMNEYDVLESQQYLQFYRDIRDYINYNEAFEEENSKLDNIVRKSQSLLNDLKAKEKELVINYIQSKLNVKVDVPSLFNSPQLDTGWFESNLQSGGFSSNQLIQLAQEIVTDAQFRANEDYNEIEQPLTDLIESYLKKYKNYSMLSQRDSKGNLTGGLVNKFSQEYYDQLIKLTGKEYWTFFRANTKVELTEEGKQLFEDEVTSLKEIYPDWNKEGSYTKEVFDRWYGEHNPYDYIQDYKRGIHRKGNFKKYIKEQPIDKWIDPAYARIKALPETDPARMLYDVLDAEFRQLARKYGNQANFIPEVSKDLMTHMLQGNFKGGFNNIKKSMVDSIFVNLEPQYSDADLDVNGVPHDKIPVYMMSDTLSPDKKSYDLGRILLTVKAQEAVLAHKAEVEPFLIMLKEVVQDLPQYVTNQSGDIVTDSNNNPLENTSVTRNANLNDQMRWIMQDYLYNKGTKQSNYFKNISVKEKTINSKGEEVVTSKVLSGSKIADAIGNVTRIKGMGLNVFSGFGNIVYGLISNAVASGDRETFGEKESLQALGIMLGAVVPGNPTRAKVDKLMKYFDVLVQTNEIKYGQIDVKSAENPLKNLSVYEFQKRGEYFVQGQTAMAMLLKKRVVALDGTELSMYDAFDNEGKWDTARFGESPFANKDTKRAQIKEIRDTIASIHGDYASGLKAKENYIGRALLIFRTWLPQSIAVRFGKEYTDLQNKTHKGRYRSYKLNHLAILPLIKDAYKAFTTSGENDTVDTRNLRRNMIELSFLPILWSVGLFLKSLIKSGDDDDDKALMTFLLNSSVRAQGDLTFFFNPYSFQSTIREPIPAFKTLMDTYDIFPAIIGAMEGEDTYKSGRNKGKSKLYTKIKKAFPIVNQPDKLAATASTVLESGK